MTRDQDYYERLDHDLSAGTVQVPSSARIRRNEDGLEDTRRYIREATGAETDAEAIRIAVGRPRIGHGRGPSPSVRVRVTPQMHDELSARARREGRTVSEVVRSAAKEYLATHA